MPEPDGIGTFPKIIGTRIKRFGRNINIATSASSRRVTGKILGSGPDETRAIPHGGNWNSCRSRFLEIDAGLSRLRVARYIAAASLGQVETLSRCDTGARMQKLALDESLDSRTNEIICSRKMDLRLKRRAG